MRRDRVLWGIVLVALGIVLLLRQLGILPLMLSWSVIGPLLLIGVGAWVLWSVATRQAPETDSLSLPLEGADRARVTLRHGVGRLQVSAGAGPGELLSGTFVGGVRQHISREGSSASVQLRVPEGAVAWMGLPLWGRSEGPAWNVRLTREATLDLHVETGASETVLDLVDLQVADLHVATGAGATRITLPAGAGHVRARIETGVGQTTIRVPQGLAARIRVESGLGDVRVDRDRFPRVSGGYESPGYAEAAHAVDLEVRSGVGAVRIE